MRKTGEYEIGIGINLICKKKKNYLYILINIFE